jgi:hypothetical protein
VLTKANGGKTKDEKAGTRFRLLSLAAAVLVSGEQSQPVCRQSMNYSRPESPLRRPHSFSSQIVKFVSWKIACLDLDLPAFSPNLTCTEGMSM